MNMRKGFTLVELLIVIVIIGILAAAMLLSSGSATAAAKATTIVSDMRSLKSASLLLYADSMDDTNLTSVIDTNKVKVLHKYMDNPEKFKNDDDPASFFVQNGEWWISYKVGDDAAVKQKLAEKASKTGLKAGADLAGADYTNGDKAFMRAR